MEERLVPAAQVVGGEALQVQVGTEGMGSKVLPLLFREPGDLRVLPVPVPREPQEVKAAVLVLNTRIKDNFPVAVEVKEEIQRDMVLVQAPMAGLLLLIFCQRQQLQIWVLPVA